MNKKQKNNVANKLDTLTNKMAERGVYTIVKENDLYTIVEVLRNAPVLRHIPTSEYAVELCEKLNRPSNKKVKATMQGFILAQRSINKLCDLDTESRLFRHTIINGEDSFSRDLAEIRLNEVRIKMRYCRDEILKRF